MMNSLAITADVLDFPDVTLALQEGNKNEEPNKNEDLPKENTKKEEEGGRRREEGGGRRAPRGPASRRLARPPPRPPAGRPAPTALWLKGGIGHILVKIGFVKISQFLSQRSDFFCRVLSTETCGHEV